MLVSVTPELSRELHRCAGSERIFHLPRFPVGVGDVQHPRAAHRQSPSRWTRETQRSSGRGCVWHCSEIKDSEAQKWDSWLVLLADSDFVSLVLYEESKMELWFISNYIFLVAFRGKAAFILRFTFIWKWPAMEHFRLYLTVSICFVAALGLAGRAGAPLRWETLRCASKGTRHGGKRRDSELNDELSSYTWVS